MALVELYNDSFEETVSSGQVVLVAFWADWVEESTALFPVLEELDKLYAGRVIIGTINADHVGFLPMEMGVVTLPTVILYSGCIEMDRVVGTSPVELYARLLDTRLLPEDEDSEQAALYF